MSYFYVTTESLQDIFKFKDVKIESVAPDNIMGEDLVRFEISGDIPDGRVRLIMHRDKDTEIILVEK